MPAKSTRKIPNPNRPPAEQIILGPEVRAWFKENYGEYWMDAMSDVLKIHVSSERLKSRCQQNDTGYHGYQGGSSIRPSKKV